MSVAPYLLTAIAAVVSSGLPGIPITTAAGLEAAIASATSSTVLRIDANITATSPGTLLTLPVGITINESGAFTVAGYFWTCNGAGNYSPTRIGYQPKRLTIQSANTNSGNTRGGTVGLREGRFIVNANVRGLNGGGSKFGNNLYFIASNTNRVEADIYGDYSDSSADLVSIDAPGASSAASASYVNAWGCQFRRPGSGGTDNWYTNHFNTRSIAVACDFAEPSPVGPGLNSDPDTSTMEIYGGRIDMTGAGTANGDLRITRIVGVEIVGTSTRSIFVLPDTNKPTIPSLALRLKSSVSIKLVGAHTVAPCVAEVEFMAAGKRVFMDTVVPSYTGVAPLIAKIKGTLAAGNDSLVGLSKGGTVYNITTIHTGAANVYPVVATVAGTVGAPNTVDVIRADINNVSPVALTFATRSDVQYTTMNVINSRITATNAGFTGGATGSTLNVSGTLLNGTEPSGGLTGWLNVSPELAANTTWQKVAAYLATCPPLPGDTSLSYPTNADSYF